jgi:tetratricopeptide (TPR) repeat protein
LGLDIVGEVAHWAGDEATGLARMDEGHALAVEHELVPVLLWTYWDRGLALCGMGRYAEAIESLHEHIELCERVGDPGFWWCRSMNLLGWAYMDLCNWDLALDHNQRSVDRALEFGDPEIIRNGQLNVADCLLATGRPEPALRLLEQVEGAIAADVDPGAEWMKWRYIQHLWASLGDAWLTSGDPSRAIEYADRCIERAEATATRRNVTKGRRARAAAMLAMGDAEGALEHLELALAAAREVGNPAQLWKTLEVQAQALDTLGRDGEAHRAYAEAVTTLEAVAARLEEPSLRDTLLSSSELRRLRVATPSSGR